MFKKKWNIGKLFHEMHKMDEVKITAILIDQMQDSLMQKPYSETWCAMLEYRTIEDSQTQTGLNMKTSLRIYIR